MCKLNAPDKSIPHFVLPLEFTPTMLELIRSTSGPSTSVHEVQLRMFVDDSETEQADTFPPECEIKINGKIVVKLSVCLVLNLIYICKPVTLIFRNHQKI